MCTVSGSSEVQIERNDKFEVVILNVMNQIRKFIRKFSGWWRESMR